MTELKYKRFGKTLNYKILSTIPVISAGMILTSTPTTAMFRTAVSSVSRTIQSSSSSSSLAKVSSTSTPKFFYNSNGRRTPIQPSTSSSLKPLLKPSSPTTGSSTQNASFSSTSSKNSTIGTANSSNQGNSPTNIQDVRRRVVNNIIKTHETAITSLNQIQVSLQNVMAKLSNNNK